MAHRARYRPFRGATQERFSGAGARIPELESVRGRGGLGEAVALRLMGVGVHVSLTRFPGVMHEFFDITKVLDAARLAVARAALAVRAGFEGAECRARHGLQSDGLGHEPGGVAVVA